MNLNWPASEQGRARLIGLLSVIVVAAIGLSAWWAQTAKAPQPAFVAVSSAPIAADKPVQQPVSAESSETKIVPAFDVARVEPDGSTLVAGHAAPHSLVDLLDSGKIIGTVKANAAGQFVILPKDLQPGSHLLSLQAGDMTSAQNITIVVPQSKKEEVLVALTAPGEPTKILSDPPPAVSVAPVAKEAEPLVMIRLVEAGEKGALFASGTSNPGQVIQFYLSDTAVAKAVTAADGHWTLTIASGMKPGSYQVRADAVDANGKVLARAEVPFDYPAESVANNGTIAVAGETVIAAAASDAVVKQVDTAQVSHGDSLWRISRRVYGRGMRYTQIYAANNKQIRNPELIYPGQVLVLPPDVKNNLSV